MEEPSAELGRLPKLLLGFQNYCQMKGALSSLGLNNDSCSPRYEVWP